jgi:hypothetical protein
MTSTILIALAVVSALIVIDVVGAFLLIKHNAKLRNKLKSMLSSFINVPSAPSAPSAPSVDTSMFVTTAQLESAAGQGQDVINQLQTRLGMMDNYVTKAQLAEASGGSEALMAQLTTQLTNTFVTQSQLEDAARQGQVELGDLKKNLLTHSAELNETLNSNFETIQSEIQDAAGEGSDIISQINSNLLQVRAQLNKLSDGYAVLYNEVNEG